MYSALSHRPAQMSSSCHISYSISSTLSCHQPQQRLHRAQSLPVLHTVPPAWRVLHRVRVQWGGLPCQLSNSPVASGPGWGDQEGAVDEVTVAGHSRSWKPALPLMSYLGKDTPLLVLPIVTLTLDLFTYLVFSFQVPKDCEPGKRVLNFLMNSKEFNLSVLSLRPGNIGCVRNSMVLQRNAGFE